MVSRDRCCVRIRLDLFLFLLFAFGFFLGFCNLGLVYISGPLLWLDTQERCTEARITHTRGVAVGNLLRQNGVARNFVPVDLFVVSLVNSRGQIMFRKRNLKNKIKIRLTSFRFFCSRIAYRNLAMTLSLLEDMMILMATTTREKRGERREKSGGGAREGRVRAQFEDQSMGLAL